MPQEDSNKYLSEEDKKLFNEIKQYKEYCENSTRDIRVNVWEEVWKLWTQYVDPTESAFVSKKRLPKVRRAVNTLAAFLVAKEPTFNALPKGEGDELKAEFAKELLQYQAKQRNMLDLKRNAKIGVKSAALFGLAVWKISWLTLLKEVEETDEKGKKNKSKKVVFDDPRVENVNVFDVYFDPYIGTIQGQRKVVQEFVLTLETLKSNKAYNVPSDIKASYAEGTSTSHYDSSRLDRYDLKTTDGDAETQGKVKIWECWTKTMVHTFGDPYGKPFKLRSMPNPYGFIPYVKMDFEVEPIPNRFYPAGAIGPNIKTNKGIDELVNNIIDNIRIIINPMYKRKRGAHIDPRQFISRPGGFIDVDESGDVDQLVTSDTTGAGFKLLQFLNGEFQAGTSVTPVRMGIGGEADSATEARIQQDNADVVSNAVKENFQDALAEIGQMVLKLDVQNMQRAHSIRIFNTDLINKLEKMSTEEVLTPEQVAHVAKTGMLAGLMLSKEDVEEVVATGRLSGRELPPESVERAKRYGKIIRFTKEFIDVDVDIEVEADSTMNKDTAVLRKQFNDTVNTIARTPGGAQRIDWELYAKIQADLSGIPEMKRLIMPPPPPQLPPPQGPEGMGQPGPVPGTIPPQLDQMNTAQGINQAINQAAQGV